MGGSERTMDRALREMFDAGVERRATGCEKWDDCQAVFGRADVLPLWVADMDFRAPQPVVDALTERARRGVFGYCMNSPEAGEALCGWMRARHALDMQPDWAFSSPGVVSSLLYALRVLTVPGDTVAIQTPVYGPFYHMAKQASVGIYRNPLKQTEVGWKMDLDHLERGFKQGVRALMLCSPHNPVGRIWTKRELDDLVRLCNRYEVGIVSDEIHMDFEMPGHTHTPILSVPGAERAIMLASASKSFNLAALRQSSVIVADEALRDRMREVLDGVCLGEPNLFGQLAQTVAYQQGAPWLDGLIEYLDESRRFVCEFVQQKLPECKLSRLEGTYLMWIDMRSLGLPQQELMKLLVEKAGVGLNDGTAFGEEGAGFVRLNLATPRRNVERALCQIEAAVRAR